MTSLVKRFCYLLYYIFQALSSHVVWLWLGRRWTFHLAKLGNVKIKVTFAAMVRGMLSSRLEQKSWGLFWFNEQFQARLGQSWPNWDVLGYFFSQWVEVDVSQQQCSWSWSWSCSWSVCSFSNRSPSQSCTTNTAWLQLDRVNYAYPA